MSESNDWTEAEELERRDLHEYEQRIDAEELTHLVALSEIDSDSYPSIAGRGFTPRCPHGVPLGDVPCEVCGPPMSSVR